MRGSDIETTTTTTICEERRAGHGRCPTWFRLLLRSSPPSPATRLRALFFFFFFLSSLLWRRHDTWENSCWSITPGAWRAQTRREKERIRVPRPIPTRTVLSVVDHRFGGVSVDLFLSFFSFMNNVRLLRFVYRIFWIIFFLKEISIFVYSRKYEILILVSIVVIGQKRGL